MDARATLLGLALLLALAGPLGADTIHRTDGKKVENVQVVSDGLKEVVYREGKNEQKLPSDQVLSIDYEKKPKLVDEAEGFIQEEDLESAVDLLDEYVQGYLENPRKSDYTQFRWAPAYASWRGVELRERVADVEGLRSAAARLIETFPDSRYVLLAHLAKANVELRSGQAPAARETLGGLVALSTSQGLPRRWELECRVLQVLSDESLKPESKRTDLQRLALEAKDYPIVLLKAQVGTGESYLAEANADQGKAKELRAQARGIFQKVVEDEAADRAILAAAYTGLGDCLFLTGADADDKGLLREAALHYLRVATVYREQGVYVPRALFYAMRCFDLMQDAARKADMRRELASYYPGSSWAAEAKKY